MPCLSNLPLLAGRALSCAAASRCFTARFTAAMPFGGCTAYVLLAGVSGLILDTLNMKAIRRNCFLGAEGATCTWCDCLVMAGREITDS
ncbi:hypothetical protein P171DRAFT_22789 [Karstenula rhodostoma CBS 690.94]|uniref:Uncharacterized protein n=1 Tax=Karstenula rhodostoma CBS 690.94 TaxID=1392251 RepID=A0A9P4PH02_9PLEO|nr:hypothetical protein P171DRAFT_22789 [Karstenula rhodostoma CBS 690.94]